MTYEEKKKELKHDAECLANQSAFAEETWGCFEQLALQEGERIGYEKGINEGLTINNVDEAYEKGLTAGGKIGRIDGEAQGRAEVVAEIKEYPWNGLSDNEIKLIGKIISRLSVGKGE